MAALFAVAPVSAQREFVEEVEPAKGSSLDNVDLDAPDPAEAEKAEGTRSPAAPETKDAANDAAKNGAKAATGDAPGDPQGSAGTASGGPDAAGGPAVDAAGTGTAATAPAAELDDVGGIVVSLTSHDALLERWDGRAVSVRKGEVARARQKITDVTDGLLDFGVQGIPGGFQATALATALLREGRRAIDDGSFEEATTLLDAAELAAPDLVAVHSERALLAWRAGDVGGTLTSLVAAARTWSRDPVSLSQLGARALGLAGAAAIVVLVLAALLMGLPALRYLSFDILQVLPKGAHGGQVLALVVLAGTAPLVVGAGPVFGSLWILTLAWLYLGARERAVAAVLAVLCLALPAGIDLAARLVAYPGSRAEIAHRALTDATAEPLRRALARRPPGELDLHERLALALAAKREGRLEDAARHYQEILAKHDEPAAHAGFGVVSALQGNEDVALAEMGKAVAADEHDWASAFNVSLLHYRARRTDKAAAAAAPLAGAVPDLLNAYRRTTFREAEQRVSHNRAFIDAYPRPMAMLAAGLEPSADATAVAVSVERWVLRGQTGTRALAMLAAFPVLWLVLFALRKKIVPSRACARCGSPASARVDGKDVPEDSCAQCFHAFLSTRTRIDAGVKLRKERAITQRRARLSRSIFLLGVLWPGAGHFFGGGPVRGLVFSLLHGLGLGALFLSSGRMPMPRLEGPWGDGIAVTLVGVVVTVVWLLGIRSSWSLAEDARAGRS